MKVENGYLWLENEPIKKKKIAGHSFVNIAGFNPFCKKGDAVLERFGLLKQEIDEKYMYRGDFAEKIVKNIYEKNNHKCVTYKKEDIGYDNFKDNPNFGGLIDIDLPEENALVEVKSKSMKDYEIIKEKQPMHEVMQGALYSYNGKKDYFYMEWIFFDEKTENLIFNNEMPKTLKDLKRFSQKYVMGDKIKSYVEKNMVEVLTYYNKCYNERKIPLNDISDEALEKLGLSREVTFNFEQLFGTLTI